MVKVTSPAKFLLSYANPQLTSQLAAHEAPFSTPQAQFPVRVFTGKRYRQIQTMLNMNSRCINMRLERIQFEEIHNNVNQKLIS